MAAVASSEGKSPPSSGPIGPGRVVLVVGPSGAGKDAILQDAQRRLAGDERFMFPQRIVTRASSAAEDHLSCTVAEFEERRHAGKFALCWSAHGLSYAIPMDVDAAVLSGACAIFNASRHVVAAARARYRRAACVLIDAPAELRASRLATRSRESVSAIERRLERAAPDAGAIAPDLVIVNDGTVTQAVERFLHWLLV